MEQVTNYLKESSNFKIFLLIYILGFIVYFNTLFNGYILDYEDLVVSNPLVHSISNLISFFTYSSNWEYGTASLRDSMGSYYRPVMLVYLSLVYNLFGNNPFLSNLFQILIHTANSFLVFLLFKRFFKKTLAIFLALIFLVHPLNDEMIYVIGIADILYLFFGLIALNLSFNINLKKAILTTVLLLLSLFSKETGVVFIIIILIYQIFIKKSFNKLFFLIFSTVLLIYIPLRFLANLSYSDDYSRILNSDFTTRLITLPKILSYYIQNFFWPNSMAVLQQWVVLKIDFWYFYFPVFLVSMVLFVWLFTLFKVMKRKKEYLGVLLFFTFWFGLGIGPHLQIIPLILTVADRWFYLPMIGFLGILAVFLNVSLLQQKRILKNSLFLTIILITALSVRTMVRNSNFENNLVLLEHDIQIDPDNIALENNLGLRYMTLEKMDQALNLFERSTKSDPNAWVNWTNLGTVYQAKRQTQKARAAYLRAIKNGDYEIAYYNLALLMLTTDTPEKTKDFTQEALKKFTLNTKLWRILAIAEYKLGNQQEAIKAAKKSIDIFYDEPGNFLYQSLLQGKKLNLEK